MSDKKTLLAVRKTLKAKKPNFLREDYDKKSLGHKWRKPTGRHSKIKHQFKGSRKMPACGYRSPVLVRGFTRDGYVPIIVHTMKDIEGVRAHHTVVIGSTVGNRKRAQLLKNIIEKKLHFSTNISTKKDAVTILKAIEDNWSAKKVKHEQHEKAVPVPKVTPKEDNLKEKDTVKEETKETIVSEGIVSKETRKTGGNI